MLVLEAPNNKPNSLSKNPSCNDFTSFLTRKPAVLKDKKTIKKTNKNEIIETNSP